MQIHKNEITTGILVLATFGVFISILIIIGLPGLIRPLKTYRIYFDNAQGIHSGAPVLLAGREIGKVTTLRSPVPLHDRPVGHSDYEVSIDVRVAKDAEIYHTVTVHLTQQGLMGQEVIDFVKGDPSSGVADDHTEFVGTRVPDLSESVSENMKRLTGPDSDLAHTIKNLQDLTEPSSSLALSIANLKLLTAPDGDLSLTIKKANTFMETLNNSHISQVILNSEQLTDTLKRQPWRLLWPSTKSYPGDKDNPSVKKQ